MRLAWVMMIPFSSWRNRGPRGFLTCLGHTASAHTYPGRNSSCRRCWGYGQVWAKRLKPTPTQGINNCCGPRTLLPALHPRNPTRWEYSWRNKSGEVKWFPPGHIATKWETGLRLLHQHPSPWLCTLLLFDAFWWDRTFGWRGSFPVFTP